MHGLLDSYDLRCKRLILYLSPLPYLLRYSHYYQRFRDEGCPNCEEFLHLQGSPDQIDSCTSQVFEGLITLADPTRSWVARIHLAQRCSTECNALHATDCIT